MNLKSFDDVLLYVETLVGGDFAEAMQLASQIIQNPLHYTGPQAGMMAMRLAVHRYRIGVAAQYWKYQSSQTKKPEERITRDALMAAFAGLEEVIMTLKLISKSEMGILQK
jgi:hypothetical protein